MKSSRSQSLSQLLSSPSLSSKINYYREKFNLSQKKFYNGSTRDISYGKKSSILFPTRLKDSNQSSRKDRPLSGNKAVSTPRQILNIKIDPSQLNPEKRFTVLQKKGSVLLDQLDTKAKQITRYAQRNSQLLEKKQNLENRINSLKQKINDEKKKISDLKCDCGVLTNNIEQTHRKWEEKNSLRIELNKKSQQTAFENQLLTKTLNQKKAESNYNQNHLELLNNQINDLFLKVSNTNSLLLSEDAARLKTKQRLGFELKVMENSAITFQELVSQKDHLNSHITQAFRQNKINQQQKELQKSSLLLQSKKK